jgi:hypothetical protein
MLSQHSADNLLGTNSPGRPSASIKLKANSVGVASVPSISST